MYSGIGKGTEAVPLATIRLNEASSENGFTAKGERLITLIDGPVVGTYMVKRAPVYLRAVKTSEGKMDVLDQVNDKPTKDEAVYVYQLEGEAGWVHLNFGGNKGGFYAMGSYRYRPDVDGESLRDNEAWREWCIANVDGTVDRQTGEISEGGE